MTRKTKSTPAGPVELEYVRLADHTDGCALPLPEGWVAETHTEVDPDVVADKLASGRYRVATNDEPSEVPAEPAPDVTEE